MIFTNFEPAVEIFAIALMQARNEAGLPVVVPGAMNIDKIRKLMINAASELAGEPVMPGPAIPKTTSHASRSKTVPRARR